MRLSEGGSCGGAPGLADGAEEFAAGALEGLGGIEVVGCGGALIEGVEGDTGAKEGFGTGQGLESLVGCGDVFLPVAPFDAAVGADDLGGQEAGPVEVEDGTKVIVEEGVDLAEVDIPRERGVSFKSLAKDTFQNHLTSEKDESIMNAKTLHALRFAAPVALLFTFAGAAETTSPEAAARISSFLSYDASDCNTNCEIAICRLLGTPGHANALMDPDEDGNDKGEIHSCAYPKSCDAHTCGGPPPGGGLASLDLTTVAGLIPELSSDELTAMHAEEPNLLLNLERNAVQVLGCQGLVLASVELTPSQVAQFADPAPSPEGA